jgi:predicted TIM-barrel fold metal-dependent hydrolase
MLQSGLFPNLYVDTSYTFFNTKYHETLLSLMKKHDNIRKRVLFGSDYYLSVQEDKESDFVDAFRDSLSKPGTDYFQQIAVTNPKEFLR